MPTTISGDTGVSAVQNGAVDLTTDVSGVLPVVNGGNGTATANASFKNRIINGAMAIWQRGTSFTPTASTVTYVTDRWNVYQANTSPTVSRSTDVPSGQGFPYSIKYQRAAGNTGTGTQYLVQIIESNNMLDLAGQNITISFWAKAGANYSGASNLLSALVYTGTVADQGAAALYAGWTGAVAPIAVGVPLTTSWQKFTLTGTIASTALEMAIAFAYSPSGTAGADDSFYLTGVQLEKGSTATSFDYRPYGEELQLCQRYYYKIQSSGTNPIASGYNANASTAQYVITYPVIMRAAPTALEQSGTANNYAIAAPAGLAVCSSVPVFVSANTNIAAVNFTATITSGQPSIAYLYTGTAYLGWSAEL